MVANLHISHVPDSKLPETDQYPISFNWNINTVFFRASRSYASKHAWQPQHQQSRVTHWRCCKKWSNNIYAINLYTFESFHTQWSKYILRSDVLVLSFLFRVSFGWSIKSLCNLNSNNLPGKYQLTVIHKIDCSGLFRVIWFFVWPQSIKICVQTYTCEPQFKTTTFTVNTFIQMLYRS